MRALAQQPLGWLMRQTQQPNDLQKSVLRCGCETMARENKAGTATAGPAEPLVGHIIFVSYIVD